MAERTAFFYGTLMVPKVLYRVIYGSPNPEEWQQKLTQVRPALLENYCRHRVCDVDYPAIVPHKGSSVRGSCVTGLTDGDIYRLDIFEGSEYVRRPVTVKVLKNIGIDEAAKEDDAEVEEVVEAETYVWQSELQALEKEEWDFDQFKRDRARDWTGVDDDDVEAVDSGFADVKNAVEGQDQAAEKAKSDGTGGRGLNGHITEQLKASVTHPIPTTQR